MASRNRILVSQSSLPSPTSPPVSRSSPLSSGTLGSYPVTTAPFTSSPSFSFSQREGSLSPDLFEELAYSEELDDDFRQIDREVAEIERSRDGHPSNSRVYVPESPPLAPARDQRTWVVFHGKVPGIYDESLCAAMQTQGFKDGFQRSFPNFDAADAAWTAFIRDKIYPDYGRGPWVVFLGRKPGVVTKVTELECSVKSYDDAIFRTCSSIAQGNIKFQLFIERVAQMFTGPDPFPDPDSLIPQPGGDDLHEAIPPAQLTTTTSVPMVEKRPRLPLAPQVAESSNSASKRNASGSSSVPPPRRYKVSRHGDGWYVAYNAVLPGVCYGMDALRAAGPVPGGFQCATDKESADRLFHELSINGAVVWADKE